MDEELRLGIHEYLRDNLTIETRVDCDGDVEVKLMLSGELISEDYVDLSHLERGENY